MKKSVLWSLIVIAVVMVVLPVIYLFTPSHWGMSLTVLSFLAINPVFSAVLGFFTGGDIRGRWWLNLASAALYLVTAWCIFGFVPAFLLYAAFYVALSFIAMGVRKLFPKD